MFKTSNEENNAKAAALKSLIKLQSTNLIPKNKKEILTKQAGTVC